MSWNERLRLLVVRLGAMGDILHALPAVASLRRRHPDWQIGWVVEPRWRELLSAAGHTRENSGNLGASQPIVDRLHLAPAKAWGNHPLSSSTLREVSGLRKELASADYDAVIDFQGAVRSAAIARLAGAARVLGEAMPREWLARWLYSERVSTESAHVIDQDLEVASALNGDKVVWTRPELPIDPVAEQWCDELLCDSPPAVFLTPGAGWGAKRWPVERYSQVAQGLADRGLRVLVNSAPGEESLAESICQSSKAESIYTSISQLIALTRRVALFVGGDTGPLHLACALGRPVVGIYGPTDPNRNGPYGTRSAVLRSPTSRRDHSRRSAPESGLLTITPAEVLREADRLLTEEKAL